MLQLHYRATFVVLLVCMMLVSTRQFIGDPIDCIADGVPGGTLNLFCWIHSTFSVPSRWGAARYSSCPTSSVVSDRCNS